MQKTIDVQVGDVWKSEANRTAKVRAIANNGHNSDLRVYFITKTGVSMSVYLDGFTNGRTLIERDGKPVETPKP